MPDLNRRTFLAATAAAGAARALQPVVARGRTRRILTLVYDRSRGMLRAIDRLAP